YRQILSLAQKLGKKEDASKYEREIDRLTSARGLNPTGPPLRRGVESGANSMQGPAALRYFACAFLSNAASKATLLGAKSTRRTKAAASAAPCSRSMPMSSHSTESGP